MTASVTTLKDRISALKPELSEAIAEAHGSLVVAVMADQLTEVLTMLRDDADLQFTQLIDVCGADYPNRPVRFEAVYQLLSLKYNARITVKVFAEESAPIPSVIDVFPSAGWYEREIWDMYGIMFSGHNDLRRILTDYGFDGHPQRKDFPLTGYTEMRYDHEQQRVIYEPVKLSQAYRSFDFLSPWEGANYAAPALPGDEKANA